MIQSVERAIDILEEVASREDWVGVREIARSVGLKVPTTQQLLKTLQARNFLEFNEELRQYRMGLGVWLLTEKINPLTCFKNKIKACLDRLCDELGETTVALTLINSEVKVVDSRQSKHVLAVTSPESGSMKIDRPHHMAGGRIVLAFSDKEFLDSYLKTLEFPEKGKNLFESADALQTEMRKVREAGHALTEDVDDSGIGALAVPILAKSGEFLMALSCSMPLNRFDEARKSRALSKLREAAETIS